MKEVHEIAMLQMEHQKDLDTLIFHAGVNDLRYKQTETLKAHFRTVAKEASSENKSLATRAWSYHAHYQ